ncbi:hypothetical protein, partial [Denitratimonas sp. CY0512]|uniref:hypothetical protein n=1 Tax=Denitratimonas sp. CY0512 TaxID=3131940 RepID=UPI0030B20BB3
AGDGDGTGDRPMGNACALQRLFHARDNAGTWPDHAQEKAPERGQENSRCCDHLAAANAGA